jgi:hypothetical protein
MIDEKNQNLINALWTALLTAQSTYLPPETVPKFNKETAEFFFKKAVHEAGNDTLQMFCIDKAIAFVSEADHLKMAAEWIHNGKIVINGNQLNCQLTSNHK